MPIWSDFFKLFSYATKKDPLSATKDPSQFSSAGVVQPDALGTDFRQGSDPTVGLNYRQTYDMIDTTTLTNRAMRYKEYERLRNIPEIETAITIFSDEACVAGDTKIATPFGFIPIKQLAEERKDERFLVYCYDEKKQDYTLGWAFAPRLVKKAKTKIITLDNGSSFTATEDHKVLLKDGTWVETGNLKYSSELMPFYRLPAKTDMKQNQYPRIYSFHRGWIHERQFVDDWRSGNTSSSYEKVNKIARMIGGGLTTRQIAKICEKDWHTLEDWIRKEGFNHREIRRLYINKDKRKIIGIHDGPEQDVYDISVEDHKCFATDSVILHNCQKDDQGNILRVTAENEEIKQEIEFLLLHRKMLNLNRNGWIWFKNLCLFGDWFLELVVNPENPKEGIYKAVPLSPETMFRIETIKGKLLEFQQSKEGPDYQAIIKGPIDDINDIDLNQTTVIRFAPSQIVHFRIGDDRKTFYPYGQSLIEPARGPAHSLRMMEDAMVTYRLSRAPERRVFYIDVGQLPPFKAEAFIDRLKDQLRKRKVTSNRGGTGANQVEERWQPPAQDEDYWLPVRPNSNTRIDTLPGAENLGEIDDAIYFRNKLLTSLNFPKNYLNNEDVAATRITLSAQDVKIARMIERLQAAFEDGIQEIAETHLQLRGYPDESFQDLRIKMTPPSDWRELSRTEVVSARYGNASTLKSSQLMSDFDIMTKILKYTAEESDEMIARLKLQKLEEIKLQVLSQNPQLLGVGIPSDEESQKNEIGAEPGGPSPEISPEGIQGIGGPEQPSMSTGQELTPPEAQPSGELESGSEKPAEKTNQSLIPKASKEDIEKYGFQIRSYELEQDHQDIDYSVEE